MKALANFPTWKGHRFYGSIYNTLSTGDVVSRVHLVPYANLSALKKFSEKDMDSILRNVLGDRQIFRYS
uniref:DRMBL domain-containing protein n=1 Tax=Steinernema glaseri TaxID=37863 RepID=A0A1I7Y9F7_9BILA